MRGDVGVTFGRERDRRAQSESVNLAGEALMSK
jgi:hypothetical protein